MTGDLQWFDWYSGDVYTQVQNHQWVSHTIHRKKVISNWDA